MSKHKVFVTRDIPACGVERLRECPDLDIVVHQSALAPTAQELFDGVEGTSALLCLLSDKVDETILKHGDKLKVVANYAVGFDNIDVNEATVRGIWVTNTPGVLTDATADLAFALLLACCRRIVEADKFTREGKFLGWGPKLLLGIDLKGATLGIVGMGRIGRALAKRALGFGMKIIYHNRNRCTSDVEEELGATYVEFQDLLRRSDVISLHLPGGETTRHLISREELSIMKEGAVLVNTARGTVIDEGALVEALKSGKLLGAGLDVFEEEPKLHPELIGLPNVTLAPHIGSATEGVRSKMALMAAENILAALGGRTPPNAVNKPAKKG